MPSANDLRKGMAIKYMAMSPCTRYAARTPGNLRAFVQATLRSLKTGSRPTSARLHRVDRSRADEHQDIDFSYKDQGGYHFMDPETYETITLHEEFVGDNAKYLTENLRCTLMEVEGKAAELELPRR